LRSRRHGRHGRCSGCDGCYGCNGGYGCHGGYGCNGFGCNGGYGCSGYGDGVIVCAGCNGSCGGCGGGAAPVVPGVGPDGGPGTVRTPAPGTGTGKPPVINPKKDGTKDGKKNETPDEVNAPAGPAPATIVVNLPANARLTIDGQPTTSTSATRVFMSPDLNPDQEFHYTLRAEWVVDGQPVVVTKKVTVSAGNETAVNLQAESVGVASR
jgi:uncharacterized protein (TIGR03000 family)